MSQNRQNTLISFIKKWIPIGAVLPVGIVFTYQCFGYFTTQLFVHQNRLDFTTKLDELVPFIPSFVYIYLFSYVFWIVTEIISGTVSKEHFYSVLTVSILGNLICTIFFIVMPTTITRPEVTGNSFTEQILRFVYAKDDPVNLFPSIHCFVSWLCYKAVWKQDCFSKGYRIFTLIFVLLICISTQVLKQHYILDVFAGIALAELLWYLVRRFKIYRPVMYLFEKINRLVRIQW